MKPTDIILTKLAFDEYVKRIHDSSAAKYGLTVEQYQHAVLSGSIVTPNTNPNTQPE
jgi:hypothetical protein